MRVGLESQAKLDAAAALEARLLEGLRRDLGGCVAALAGDDADYLSKSFRGERSLNLRRICRIATRPEREARAAGSNFALTILDAVRPSDGTLPGEAVARLLQEATDTIAAYTRAMDDGTLTAEECERILSELNDLERATSCARAVVEGERRRRLSA